MKPGTPILALALAFAAGDSRVTSSVEMLTIGPYTLVASQPFRPGLVDETYSGMITNGGGPLGRQDAVGVVATVYSRSPQVHVLDRTLTFGNVRAGATVASRDTFTVRKPPGVPLNPAHIQWQVSWRPDVILPESWAGTWQFDVSAFDVATGALESRHITTDIVRPDDAIGLALARPPAHCKGRLADDLVEVECRLTVATEACAMRGELQLTGSRTDNTLTAGGAWTLTASGDCGPFVRSGGQRLEVVATRTSVDTTAPYESATSLAGKLLPPSLLLEPAPSGALTAPVTIDDCKNDGWRLFNDPPFANQGQCVRHVHIRLGRS